MSNSKKISTTTKDGFQPEEVKLSKSAWLILQYLQSLALNNEHENHSFLYKENLPTQEAIGRALGISRATVNTCIKKLKEADKIEEVGKAYIFPFSGAWTYIPKQKIDQLFEYVRVKKGSGTIIRVLAILLWAKRKAGAHPLCISDFISAMRLDNNAAARLEVLECLGYLNLAGFAVIGKTVIRSNARKPYAAYWIIDELTNKKPDSFQELIGEKDENSFSKELIEQMQADLGL